MLHEQGDRYHVLVSSISTSDKNLFPGIGQIILHTSGEGKSFSIKGTVIVTPEYKRRYIYFSLAQANAGKEVDVIFATKYGMTLPVLKMQLRKRGEYVSERNGGFLKIKILKNGIFDTYLNFEMQLVRSNGEWVGKIKKEHQFVEFQSMYFKASRVGVKKVFFE